MTKFLKIGAVLGLNGKSYEVVEGSGDSYYLSCGNCAFCAGAGKCVLSAYAELTRNCVGRNRPDGKDVHYVETDKIPTYIYEIDSCNEDVTLKGSDEVTEDEPKCGTNGDKYRDEPTPINTPKNPKLSEVRALDLSDRKIEGLLITTEDGSQYIMPYGSKVLMDGSCNLVQFKPDTITFLTPYRDMNGRQIYTGDKLHVVTIGKDTKTYTNTIVEAKKNGVVPLFYKEDTDGHSSDLMIVDNMVINGVVTDTVMEVKHVLDWLSTVKESVFKMIGASGSELGAEEYKTIYKIFFIEEFFKNLPK